MHFKTASAALVALASTAFALPQGRQSAPSVSVSNGTIVGSTSDGIDSFMGIPFAMPPVGNLRLRPPQCYDQAYPGGTLVATEVPTACPQFEGSFSTAELDILSAVVNTIGDITDIPFLKLPTKSGEDCLTLNVQRPEGTTSDSKLPVMVYIFGGGFEFGSTQSYDGSKFLQAGISGEAAGNPLVYVAMNYRVGGFGFLGGQEIMNEGASNLGLRDQRLALQWIQDNIAAFGGDPTRVTIWGESAGSMSVFDHLLINGGDNTYNGQPLFHGAIMDSGTIVPAEPVNTGKAQEIYDLVVAAAGCSGSSDTLGCLRTVDYDVLLKATCAVPAILSFSSLNLSYLPRPDPTSNFFPVSPDIAVANGLYAKMPVIIGDQEDEGTLFALFQFNITSTADIISYLESFFPVSGASLIPNLVNSYPTSISDGSPFNTGWFNDIYPEFKRLAAILGDVVFTLTRRAVLNVVASEMPAWSYIDSHLYLLPVLGTFHTTDVLEAFSDAPETLTGTTYQTFYTSFAYYQDPNAIQSSLINWPQWTSDNPQLLHMYAAYNTLMEDNFRMPQYNALMQNFGMLRV